MTPAEKRAVDTFEHSPLLAKELALAISLVINDSKIDLAMFPLFGPHIVNFQTWLAWAKSKRDSGQMSDLMDLREAEKVLRGGKWNLNFLKGKENKKKAFDILELQRGTWLWGMRSVLHRLAAENKSGLGIGLITSDQGREFADTYNFQPKSPKQWGKLLIDKSFENTGREVPSAYETNNNRCIDVFRSRLVAQGPMIQLKLVP